MLDNNSLLAYDQPIQGKHVKIELLDFNFAVVDSIEGDCVGGSLTKDAESTLRRSGTIELCVPIDNTATTFLDAVNGCTISFGGKIWLDKYIKVYIGIDSLQTGETAWQSFGICLMDEPTRDFSSTEYRIRFSVIDLMARLTGLRFGQLTAMATVIEAVVTSGSTVTRTKTEDALVGILTELGSIKNYAIYPIPTKYEYLPYDIKVDIGATVWDLVSQFMNILSGWQIYFDDDGILRVEPIPSGVHNPAYPLEYKDIISAKVSTDFQSVKNQIVVYGRTNTPSFVGTVTGSSASGLEVEVEDVDPAQDFIVGATIIAFKMPNTLYALPQMNKIYLTLHNQLYDPYLVDYGENTSYVPAQDTIMPNVYYCIRLYSATLNNDGTIDTTQPMTWEWLGKQQVSACLVVDNRESPFYVNNQIPNSYWGGYAVALPGATPNPSNKYQLTINDQDAPITTLLDGTIITFMVTAQNIANQNLTVKSSSGTTILSQVPIYENGSALSTGKMSPDYTIFMVQFDSADHSFNFLGRHPYALTKVLSGGVYDNIVADLLAQESAKYELYLTTSLQNNIDISIVPSFALDVNTKIPFADQWAMPYKIADKYPTPLDYFLIKTITYPLGADGTAQEINAIQIYTDENLVGDDYVTPPVSAGFPTQLGTPTISLSGSVLTITGASGADTFVIYHQTIAVLGTVSSRTVDLATLPSIEPGNQYNINVEARSLGYYNSDRSNSVTYSTINMPAKGDLITMNVDGSDKQFRVLKVEGNNAEVVMMTNASNSQVFGTTQTYAGSSLDTYLNSTWYATLNATAKAAIVDKTFTQDSWYWDNSGNPDYSGYYGATKPGATAYTISLGNAAFGSSITRHVYALSVQDVLDYVLDTSITDGQLQNYNIWKMFWNDEVQHTGNSNYLWLRSASASSSSGAFRAFGIFGYVHYGDVGNIGRGVRPAFTIDLTKITWSPST